MSKDRRADEAAGGIDIEAVTGWMRECGQDVGGALRLTRIGLGQSNLTYLAEDDIGHRWVLRRPPLGLLLTSAHDVGREARILKALESTDVPVPRIFGVTDSPMVTDVPLVLMEYVDGLAVDWMSVAEGLTPTQRRTIGMSMPKALARVHAVDLPDAGLDGLASRKPYAARQLKRWAGQWDKVKTRELPALDELTRRLADSMPRQTETTLVHGDFHLRNVLVSRTPTGTQGCGAVVAVLDWELSTLGDPLADIGSMLAYWPEAGEDFGVDFAATALEGSPTREMIADEYLRLTGRDEAQLRYWHVLGLWKVAVIAEGVMRRAMEDPRNRAAAGTPTVARIDRLVHMATEVANASGI